MRRKLLSLLLSLAMIVTFMPMSVFAEEEEAPITGEPGIWAELFVGASSADCILAPGMSVDLEAKLFEKYYENGVLKESDIEEGVEFKLVKVENNSFHEGDGEEPIVEFKDSNSQTVSDDADFSENSKWTATAKLEKEDEFDAYKYGCAIYRVEAMYNGNIYASGDRAFNVESNWTYTATPETKYDEEGKIYSDVDLTKTSEDSGVVFTLSCEASKASNVELEYRFELGQYSWDEELGESIFKPFDDQESYEANGNILRLTKGYVFNTTKNVDPNIIIKVDAITTDSTPILYAAGEYTIKVFDGRIDMVEYCHAEYPEVITLDDLDESNQYNYKGAFKIFSNDEEPQEVIPGDDTFSWSFFDEAPAEGLEGEDFDQFAEEHSVLNEDENTLTLDHFGTYWAVTNPGTQYRGFIIVPFELTNAKNYFTVKPTAKELNYNGEAQDLINPGVIKKSENNTKVLYALGDGEFDEPIPAATEFGTYRVRYRVDSDNAEYVIPEKTIVVNINRTVVHVDIAGMEKEYGEADPEPIIELEDNSAIDKSLIRATRIAGEAIKEDGYPYIVHCSDENYIIDAPDARLRITKADYKFYAEKENVTIPKSSQDGVSIKYDANIGITEDNLFFDNNLINVALVSNTLTITPVKSAVGSADINIHLDGDEHHNDLDKCIHVNVTDNIGTKDNITVDAVSSDTKTKLENVTLDVEETGVTVDDATLTAIKGTDAASEPISIELTPAASPNTILQMLEPKTTEDIVYNDDTELLVKIKIDPTTQGELAGGSAPKAWWIDEPEAGTTTAKVNDAWYETDETGTYICFKVNHLSKWVLTAEMAKKIGSLEFNLKENDTVPLSNGVLSFSKYILTDTGEPVDKSKYVLEFASLSGKEKSNIEESDYTPNAVTEEGTYLVRARAIENQGYSGTTEPVEIIVGEKTHSFAEGWSSDEKSHWHACTEDGCGEISELEEHDFVSKVKSDYLANPATCTENAEYYKSCSVCGARSEETFTAKGTALGHSLSFVEAAENAGEGGFYEHYQCTNCGKCFSDRYGWHERDINQLREPNNDPTDAIVAGTVIVGATVATIAIVKTVDILVKEAEAAKEAEEAARLLEEAKTAAHQAINEALGASKESVVNELFDKGYAAIEAATTPDEVLNATAEYVNLINVAKNVRATKITQNKLKASDNGKIKVSFKNPELEGTVSYQVARSTKKDFSKSVKKYTVKTKDQNTVTWTNTKKLKKGTKYYYKVRAKVELADGTVVWSKWSSVKYATCKKNR